MLEMLERGRGGCDDFENGGEDSLNGVSIADDFDSGGEDEIPAQIIDSEKAFWRASWPESGVITTRA